MAITIKHAKHDNIADWTQADLDAQIAAGNYPPGTLLADIVLPSDWNNDHTVTGLGTMATQDATNVAITGGSVNNTSQSKTTITDYESFTPTTAPSYVEGELWYDSTAHALAYYNDSSNSTVHIGQDLQIKVINNTGSTIANGSPVYVTSTSSGQTYPNIALAQANSASTASVIGLTNGAIANGAIGYVTSQGGIDNVNTGTFTVGQVLYLSPYSAGQLMNTIPPTGITVQVGVVSYVNSSTGKIYVKQTTPLAVPASIITGQVALANGGTSANLTAVNGGAVYSTGSALAITAAGTSGQVLTSSGAGAPTWTTPTTGTVTSVTGTAPIASSGGATPAISISQATTSTNGYLSSTDWNTFNGKQPAGTYVTSVGATSPVTSSGGTTPTIAMPAATTSVSGYLTSTDWTTFNNKGSGTVTNVSALTLGTTGTDLSSSVATGTTTPVITLNVPTASATNRGVLSSTDWTTFNNKGSGTVTSVSWTGGIVSVGTSTTTPAFTIAGTSGGIPYFSSGTTWASSAALASNALVIGGGAGVAPSTLASTGTTTTVLHGNASGAPTFGAVSLTADVSGTLPSTNGGTGTATTAVGDLLQGGATNTWTKLSAVATGNALISGGITTASSWGKIGLTTHVTGILPVANGGTNASAAGITAFNNITGYTASGATGTTSTNLVFSTAPTFTTTIDGGATFGAFGSSTALTMGYTGTGATSTTNISTAALTGAFTKTINIGTNGTTGSTTAINIGTSVGSTTTITGTVSLGTALPIASGGTNSTATPTAGGAGYGTGTAHAYTAAGTSGQPLISAGSSAPAFGTLALGTANTNVSGTLTVTNGGTGASTLTGIIKGTGTTAMVAATAGTDYVAPGTATNFTAQQYFGTSTLTDGATISWAANTQQVATVTIAGNRTMAAPTGLVSGAFYALNVIQDATGSRTMTWNTVFKWTGGTAPTLSTAANAKDFFVFRSDGTNLYEQGRSLGVA